MHELRERGWEVDDSATTVLEASQSILKALKADGKLRGQERKER